MKGYLKSAVTLVCLVCTLLATFTLSTQFDSTVLAGDYRNSTWFPVVNLNHNAFHSWRLDHATMLAAWLFPDWNFAERPVIGVMTLLLGTYVFLRRCDVHGSSAWVGSPWLGAVISLGFILLITGLDPVVIGAVAWLPFIALCAYEAMTSSHARFWLLALLLVSLESAYSSNQAALLSAGTALWLTYLMALSAPSTHRRIGVACSIALVPALIATVSAPVADLPSYPKSAHVLPYDGLYATLRPLLGPAYPFDILDRAAMRSLYGAGSVLLLMLAIVAWWTRRRHQTAVARYTAKVGLVLALLALLSTCLPEPWATISPLPSLSRIVPWGTSYSVTSIALGLSAWMTVTSLVLNTAALSLIPLTAAALALTSLGSPHVVSPLLRKEGLVNDERLRPLILTPSAAIFRTFAESHLDISKQLDTVRAASRITGKDIREFNADVEVYPPPSPEVLEIARATESVWRWSSRTGSQRGNELLTVRFKAPTEIRGIELDPGPFSSDYPRGLTIAGGPCERSEAPVLAEYPLWQGSLHVLPRGIPYYAPRNEVRVILQAPTQVSCLFIYQTAKAPFDWSVSRVKVIL